MSAIIDPQSGKPAVQPITDLERARAIRELIAMQKEAAEKWLQDADRRKLIGIDGVLFEVKRITPDKQEVILKCATEPFLRAVWDNRPGVVEEYVMMEIRGKDRG